MQLKAGHHARNSVCGQAKCDHQSDTSPHAISLDNGFLVSIDYRVKTNIFGASLNGGKGLLIWKSRRKEHKIPTGRDACS